MKKCFSVLVLLFLLGGCANVQDAGQSKVYHEIETAFTQQIVDDSNVETLVDAEVKRLAENGESFWYDQSRKIEIRQNLNSLRSKFECKNHSGEDCSIVGLTGYKGSLPVGFKVDENKCDEDEFCLVTEPVFKKNLANKINAFEFYGFGKDIYMIGNIDSNENYSVYKNDEEIFSHRMLYGAESVIQDANIVLDSPAFTFHDLEGWEIEGEEGFVNGNRPIGSRNIWYRGETVNEKYGVTDSSYLFSFRDKTGFVAEKDGKYFFFFNGQKVSEGFDMIITHGCCAVFPYPIKIDENGILFFMAKRGEKFFLVEVNLNEYLK